MLVAALEGGPPEVVGGEVPRLEHRPHRAVEHEHALLERMLQKLDAVEGYISLRLPYFVMKTAPVSGVESLMDYQLALNIERRGQTTRYRQTVVVPVTSLCPCSKKVAVGS